jgi:hypothetical protein
VQGLGFGVAGGALGFGATCAAAGSFAPGAGSVAGFLVGTIVGGGSYYYDKWAAKRDLTNCLALYGCPDDPNKPPW